MYFGFDDAYLTSQIFACFGPSADCSSLCESLPPSSGLTVVGVEVCERVPSPDGWADAGYRGWEDAGYVSMTLGDGGVDPALILHVVFRIYPFCGN
jgi:hypothetical protein